MKIHLLDGSTQTVNGAHHAVARVGKASLVLRETLNLGIRSLQDVSDLFLRLEGRVG